MRLGNDVVIVTGGTRGLGRSIASAMVHDGASVVITGRTEELGRRAEKELNGGGPGRAMFVRCDMTDERQVRTMVGVTVDTFGTPTVLVNNAAPTNLTVGPQKIDGSITEISLDSWNDMLKHFVTGPFLAMRHVMPLMVEAGYGSVINMSSITTRMPIAGNSGYAAAKSALHGLTRVAALDAGPSGVRVNCIMVGLFPRIDTDLDDVPEAAYLNTLYRTIQDPANPFSEAGPQMQMLQRYGTGSDLAALTLFLASRDAAFLTGMVIPCDGGASAKAPVPAAQ
jgi:NAD(P)-dependent dehydrogenase (short-subunit alcohol dehydrogenase family)